MAYLTIFRKEPDGYYACGCGKFDIIDYYMNSHISKDIPEYCINGIQLGKDCMYKCICGKRFSNLQDSQKHSSRTRCMLNAIDDLNRTCKICNFKCRSEYDLRTHEKSKTHLEKLNGTYLDLDLECNICKIKCTSKNQMKTHLETKKHQDMVAKGEIAEDKISLTCDICNITCPSQKTIRAHLETKKHQKNLLNNSRSN